MSSSSAGTEEKAIQYLEEKYGKEFEVMWSKEGSKLFEDLYGGDLITVHPKGEPEIVFTIQEDGDEYVDLYLPAKWANELQKKVEDQIASEFPPETRFKVILRNTGNDESLKNQSVEEILKTGKNVGVSIIAGIKTSGQPDVNQYSQGIYNVFNLLKGLDTKQYVLSVGFVDESEDIDEYINTAYINNIPWSNLDAKVYGEVNVDFRLDPENPSPNVEPSMILEGPENVIENYESFGE
ncbi:hypothetical protein [Bacillus sp. 1P02SD]|uniref:hypothetical protein n=1 Tax=Bacillus sp. 1P02SD TaxID=3132264 RepID=UPI0039A3146A